jgi:transcriptional regulator with PAS, ATPase and Fis domain
MTFAQRQQRERDRAIRAALRKHKNVRRAAAALGMARSTLHERACELGIRLGPPGRRKVRRGR